MKKNKKKYRSNTSQKEKYAVMYTRESIMDQSRERQGLMQQETCIKEYAEAHGYAIVDSFGGCYSSDSDPSLREIRDMKAFIKKNYKKVCTVLVYSHDRLSRNYDIFHQLKKEGLDVISVTENNLRYPSGILMQDLLSNFTRFDNDLRNEKSIYGMIERLDKGYWVGMLPIGYNRVVDHGEQRLIVNDEGAILRKAFYMKAIGEMNTYQIAEKISKWGLKIELKQLEEIFQNPFYAGLIVHRLLKGKIVPGKHDNLISIEVFNEINIL